MTDTMTVEHVERDPIRHELKCWESYFRALADCTKNFEIRKFDRDFRIGDTLRIRETDFGSGAYTGREVTREITYILAHETDLGLMEGYCILSLLPTA
jgi:hypothetical protein